MPGSLPQDAAPALPEGVGLEQIQTPDDGVGPARPPDLSHPDRRLGDDARAPDGADSRRISTASLRRSSPPSRRQEGDGPLTLGDEYVVRMPGPWDGPVRVIAETPTSFRLATLAGHLEAGQIEFRAGADHRSLSFEIESWARSGDRFSDALYSHLRLAKEVQLHMWVSVLGKVAELATGTKEGGAIVTTRRIDPPTRRARARRTGGSTRRLGRARRPARQLRHLPARGVHGRGRLAPRRHGRAAARGGSGTARTGRQLGAHAPAGDGLPARRPAPGARRLRRPDALRRTRHAPADPVRRGCASASECGSAAPTNGRATSTGARPGYGWYYDTLEGHFEQGRMHYEVWKWLDTGEVEFSCTRSPGPPQGAVGPSGLQALRPDQAAAVLPADLPAGPTVDRSPAGGRTRHGRAGSGSREPTFRKRGRRLEDRSDPGRQDRDALSRPEPGGSFTFDGAVTNTSNEPMTITSLTDDVYGNVATQVHDGDRHGPRCKRRVL